MAGIHFSPNSTATSSANRSIDYSEQRNNSRLAQLRYPNAAELYEIMHTPRAKQNAEFKRYATTMRTNYYKAMNWTSIMPARADSLNQNTPGMSIIYECHCVPPLSRELEKTNSRAMVEQKIIQEAKKLQDSGIVPHIVSLGCGGLGQEVRLLQGLLKAGIKQVNIDIIDQEYGNISAGTPENQLNMLTHPTFKDFFAKEIAINFSSALGFKLALQQTGTGECSNLYQLIAKHQSKEMNQSTDTDITLRIFKNTVEYLKEYGELKKTLKKKTPRPNIIYDIDFINSQTERNKEAKRLTDIAVPKAHHFSLNPSEDYMSTSYTHKTREGDQWNAVESQVFKAPYR